MMWWLSVALAQEPPPPLGEQQLAFADSLLAQGLVEQAMVEYQRAAFTLGEQPQGQRAQLSAAWCLAQMNYVDEALAQYRVYSGPAFVLGQAETQYQDGRYNDAMLTLQGLDEPSLADVRAYREAWILVRQDDMDGALARWDAVPAGPLQVPAQSASAQVRAWEPLRLPSPAVAGVLSAVLPGAGQLYANEPRDAGSALLTNGLLIAGTVALAKNERWVGTGVLGAAALSFYVGNISSAVNAARRTSQRRESARLQELEVWELQLALPEEGAAWDYVVSPP